MKENLDFLIVGQGIAGSLMAYFLEKAGVDYGVISSSQDLEGEFKRASLVSMGVINPIVFKRINKGFMVDAALDCLEECYEEIGEFLGKKYLEKNEILRIFSSKEERKLFEVRMQEDDFENYIDKNFLHPEDFMNVNMPFGGAFIKRSGFLKCRDIIIDFREFLKKNEKLFECTLKKQDVNFKDKSILNFRYQKLIFATGFDQTIMSLPNLKFKNVLGDVLVLKINDFDIKNIVNSKGNLLKYNDDTYLFGSNYLWNLEDNNKKERILNLEKNLRSFLKKEYKINAVFTGIRPASFDRRPYVGELSNQRDTYILNGLGTKGVILAPLMCKILFKHIFENENIIEALNPNRASID